MRIRTLGRSGLRVSELRLGTMTFDTLAAAGTSVPKEIVARPDEASAFIDIIQRWLGNR